MQPSQARARQTLDNVLEITAQLLDEVGIDALTTNLVARRAGIPVRSVYRYFPNKYAIVAALWKRMLGEWDAWLEPGLARIGTAGTPWLPVLDDMYRAYARWLSRRRGAWVVRRALQAVPELGELTAAGDKLFAERFAAALQRRGVALPLAQLRVISTVLVTAANGVLHADLARYGRVRRESFSELMVLSERYLAPSLAAATKG